MTLAQVMGFIAAIALALGLSRSAPVAAGIIAAAAILAGMGVGVYIAIHTPLDAILGVPCPHCRERMLRRITVSFSSTAYFRCRCCGARCKRTRFSLLPRWQDALGPDDDAVYEQKSISGQWEAYSTPDLGALDTMSGKLLRNQRMRKASPEVPAAGRQQTP